MHAPHDATGNDDKYTMDPPIVAAIAPLIQCLTDDDA